VPQLLTPEDHAAGGGAMDAKVIPRLRLANDYGELRRMSEWLRSACENLGVGAERIDDLELCANEAVANIIAYAYEGAAPREHAIELRIERVGSAARLTVEDDGNRFDPLAAELPEPPPSLAEAPIGGLGIKLVRGMMAQCAYRYEGGRNVFSMTTHP
jgi:anti-sigma regulatory factor (Ser/Thr protein kinase)